MNSNQNGYVVYDRGIENRATIRGSYDPSRLGEKEIDQIIREQYGQIVGATYNPDNVVVIAYTTKRRDVPTFDRRYRIKCVVNVTAQFPDDNAVDQLRERMKKALK